MNALQPVWVERAHAEVLFDIAPERDPTGLQVVPHGRVGVGVRLGDEVFVTYSAAAEDSIATEVARTWFTVPDFGTTPGLLSLPGWTIFQLLALWLPAAHADDFLQVEARVARHCGPGQHPA